MVGVVHFLQSCFYPPKHLRISYIILCARTPEHAPSRSSWCATYGCISTSPSLASESFTVSILFCVVEVILFDCCLTMRWYSLDILCRMGFQARVRKEVAHWLISSWMSKERVSVWEEELGNVSRDVPNDGPNYNRGDTINASLLFALDFSIPRDRGRVCTALSTWRTLQFGSWKRTTLWNLVPVWRMYVNRFHVGSHGHVAGIFLLTARFRPSRLRCT